MVSAVGLLPVHAPSSLILDSPHGCVASAEPTHLVPCALREQEESDEERVRSERSERRLRVILAEAQEAVHGWEVAEDGIEELERQLGLLHARVTATEAELATSRVRAVSMPYHIRLW
jgi:hypothetical protein